MDTEVHHVISFIDGYTASLKLGHYGLIHMNDHYSVTIS